METSFFMKFQANSVQSVVSKGKQFHVNRKRLDDSD